MSVSDNEGVLRECEGGRERRGERIQRTRGEVMKEKTERYECDS